MNQSLQSLITLEEIKSSAFDLGATKSPGPDGFSGTLGNCAVHHSFICLSTVAHNKNASATQLNSHSTNLKGEKPD